MNSDHLFDQLRSGDLRALSRAITLVENQRPGAKELLERISENTYSVPILGFTGPPGVGKSTLINAFVTHLRTLENRVAVVSVDPSSPLGGGAILGDRLRMNQHASDPDVFIRSIAARGHLGGLSPNISDIVSVLQAAAWDLILLETVGTGQSEVEIIGVADVCLVVSCPGMGDEIQAMKSGILDISDVLVVNKADLPESEKTVRSLQGMLKLREQSRQNVPVVETVATEGRGISELAKAVEGVRVKTSDSKGGHSK
ncbi:MAG TPA: methylmalonyl Co-A mutase-associated GTPase MeaB [Xanthomonadales bacterium]|nr:methylmalonyl Co-A mutase-associated GTPase MeaB [Xanthomonadales bacterium]